LLASANNATSQAVAGLTIIGFFVLLGLGEHTATAPGLEPQPLRLEDPVSVKLLPNKLFACVSHQLYLSSCCLTSYHWFLHPYRSRRTQTPGHEPKPLRLEHVSFCVGRLVLQVQFMDTQIIHLPDQLLGLRGQNIQSRVKICFQIPCHSNCCETSYLLASANNAGSKYTNLGQNMFSNPV
jgi:hypothetical protein